MQEATLNIINGIKIFSAVDRETLTYALSLGSKEEEFTAGGIIHSPESSFTGMGIIISGEAEARSVDVSRNALLRRMSDGDVFGVANLFEKEQKFVSVITAVRRTDVVYIDEKAIDYLIHNSDGFVYSYIGFLSGRIRFLNRKITYLTSGSAERRLALYLSSFGTERVSPDLPMNAVADLLGIGRASLYRAVDSLSALGLIERDGDIFIIPDMQKLKNHFEIE